MDTLCKDFDTYDIHALRSRIGAYLTDSDCRVALREAGGDFDRAISWLLRFRILDRIQMEMDREKASPV